MTCATCKTEHRTLLKMDCPLIPFDDMAESDGTLCHVCNGTGEILVCRGCHVAALGWPVIA